MFLAKSNNFATDFLWILVLHKACLICVSVKQLLASVHHLTWLA